jgi:hypothetical protein
MDAAFEPFFGKKYVRLAEQGKQEAAEELRCDFINNYLAKGRARQRMELNPGWWTGRYPPWLAWESISSGDWPLRFGVA